MSHLLLRIKRSTKANVELHFKYPKIETLGAYMMYTGTHTGTQAPARTHKHTRARVHRTWDYKLVVTHIHHGSE